MDTAAVQVRIRYFVVLPRVNNKPEQAITQTAWLEAWSILKESV